MNKLKIFWKKNCPNCPSAKELGLECEKAGKKVEYYNVETPDGLAESGFYNILSTPALVITDAKDVQLFNWSGKLPVKEELVCKI